MSLLTMGGKFSKSKSHNYKSKSQVEKERQEYYERIENNKKFGPPKNY